jgi:two-component system alkaline phosphatase synthesis response regulator PhoP
MSRKILVVDDNVDSLTIIRSMLESRGYTVRAAQSGPEALAQLEREVPDLVLLDVMMPEMSGLEVLERLRSAHATAKVPVIMVTAKMQDDDLMAGYQHGADYYITKPCTSNQLLYGIGLVLGRTDDAPGVPDVKDEST